MEWEYNVLVTMPDGKEEKYFHKHPGREARQARSFPPRRRTLRRRNRDRQRASIQKATWHRSGATDRTTELVELTGAGSSAPPRGRAALPASSTILETRVMCSPGLEVEVELAAPLALGRSVGDDHLDRVIVDLVGNASTGLGVSGRRRRTRWRRVANPASQYRSETGGVG